MLTKDNIEEFRANLVPGFIDFIKKGSEKEWMEYERKVNVSYFNLDVEHSNEKSTIKVYVICPKRDLSNKEFAFVYAHGNGLCMGSA